MSLDDIRARIEETIRRCRTVGEYANGYNSDQWCAGRIEGLQFALRVLDGDLPDGQWSGH